MEEAWFILVVSLCLCALLRSLFHLLLPSAKNSKNLPPGPPTVPVIGSFSWLRRPFSELEPILRDLHARYGPVVTLRFGSRPAIFIADRGLAHQALVQAGAAFASRPRALPVMRIASANQHNINSAPYGPTWRLLRRNLAAEILHPSRVRSFSRARGWVLGVLLRRLESESESGSPVRAVDHIRFAMFCLLALMCFGDKLDEQQIKRIEDAQRGYLLSLRRFNVLNFWPSVGKILFRKRWQEFYRVRKNQEDVLMPLVRARRSKAAAEEDQGNEHTLAYADTLLDLELPEEKRKLRDEEILTLCSEFLNAGTDTTATALEWIMANLVKHPEIQNRVFEEAKGVAGSRESVNEEDLQKMPYLKAVVLEALRRHPPGHFLLPHAVTEEAELGGYAIPEHCSVNFMVAEMGWDPQVWEDPMAFKPERFLNEKGGEEFDITGSREIKMMPFGAGRRICPGLCLALLHLEYFVANLVWRFRWDAVEGDDVDLSEKPEFTIVMKNPLSALLSSRMKPPSETILQQNTN